ncbi:MAG: pyridoxamine 5'-phosphate oxidase family protein, partial [Acidimicrobiales bacterium]
MAVVVGIDGPEGAAKLDRSGLEVLDRAECLRLLETAAVGRIGITVGALPVVLPVRFQLQGERIVFVATIGSTLEGATRDAVVAFEADQVDPQSCAG